MYIIFQLFLCLVRDVVGRCGEKEIQDATALNDADSGLQMAVSSCSAMSASPVTSAALNDPQYNSRLAVTTTGLRCHSGVQHMRV